jgi:hypothetical protein
MNMTVLFLFGAAFLACVRMVRVAPAAELKVWAGIAVVGFVLAAVLVGVVLFRLAAGWPV